MISGVRRSASRWRTLSSLLLAVERGIEAAARLDAYRSKAGRPLTTGSARARAVDVRLSALERRIDVELDRLTAERLRQDLAAKPTRASGA